VKIFLNKVNFVRLALFAIFILLTSAIARNRGLADDELYYIDLSESIYSGFDINNLNESILNSFAVARADSRNFLWVLILACFKNSLDLLLFLRIFLIFIAIEIITREYKFSLTQYLFLLLYCWPFFYYSFTFLRDDILICLLIIVIFKNFNLIGYLLLCTLVFSLRFYWGLGLGVVILDKLNFFKKRSWLVFFAPLGVFFLLDFFKNIDFSYFDLSEIAKVPLRFLFSPLPWQISPSTSGLYENIFLYSVHFIVGILLMSLLLITVNFGSLFCNIKYSGFILFVFGLIQYVTVLAGPRQVILFQILAFSWALSQLKYAKLLR
jgi:hypothetical protein